MTTYSPLNTNEDQVVTRTLLHEAIPLTGTIVSGTYADANIKDYAHGMFQSVYDYPYLSSSANHIFDITAGYSAQSDLSSSTNAQNSKKLNIYSQMAQVLVGYDSTGAILSFDQDGDFAGSGGDKHNDLVMFNFARLLTKDEIKKGTFEMEFGVTPAYSTDGTTNFASRVKITDYSGSNGFLVNSPAGEYGVLYATQSAGTNVLAANQRYAVGLVYYQAGVAVLSSSLFQGAAASAATATVTVADGDAAHGLTAGQKITITAHDGTIVDYFVSDTADGGVAHLAAVTAGATLKSTGAITATLTAGATGQAVGFDTSGATTQNGFLALLKAAMEDASGHGAKITVSAVPGAADGAQSITLTQASNGASGNTFITENVANLTSTNFTGGADNHGTGGGILNTSFGDIVMTGSSNDNSIKSLMTGSNINIVANGIRNRLYNLQFNNTIELNSSIYFCRVKNNQYNYSSNPTYLSSSQIRVKEFSTDMPVSYITTVGLYSSSNELLAVAKLSEPLKKTPDTEFTIRVRLDY